MSSTKDSLARIFAKTVLELISLRRLTRFWTLAFILTLISQTGYVISCWYLAYHLPYDPTSGINAPKYLLGNIDPTVVLFFQWAALLLMFDVAHRHTRNLIAEVLETSPLTNLEMYIGRTLAVVGIVWLVVVMNIATMQLVGSCSVFGWNFAETLQSHSVLNLVLIDMPANLLFWCALVILLNVLFRTRLLILLVGGSLMFGWYWLIIRSPFSLSALVSPSSNDTMFVSELTPSFISLSTASIRISQVFFAILFLVAAALLQNRLDGGKARLFNIALFPTSLFLGVFLLVVGAWGVLSPTNEFQRWKQFHAEYLWDDDIDMQRISGRIHIDPNGSLDIGCVVKLLPKSDESTQPLVFTFNPGLNILELRIDGREVDHTFDHGLLEIQSDPFIESGVPFELTISASGVPDPHFAYLDSVVDYLNDRSVPVRLAQLLGKEGSIFKPTYVALMPGSYWYPIPGPMNASNVHDEIGRDFFEVDLAVTLEPKNWSLVASAPISELMETPKTFAVQTKTAVPALGLFASRFEHANIEVGGVEFSMFLHKKHTDNLRPIAEWNDAIRSEAEEMIAKYQERGLSSPLSVITFVEVPRSLRTIGGGWRMNSVDTLPGLVLLKEHGYPRAKLKLALDRYLRHFGSFEIPLDENEKVLAPLNVLTLYFNRGKGTDAPWTSTNKHLWTHHTSPVGEHASMIDHVVNWLVASLPPYLYRQFSIYSTVQVAELTTLRLDVAEEGMALAASGNQRLLQEWYESVPVRVERTFHERPSNWAQLRRNAYEPRSESHRPQQELELLLIRSREIAIGLLAANEHKKLYSWLSHVRSQYLGQTFTYANLISSAQAHEINYEPFLTEWIVSSVLPGILVHDHKIQQISDDEQGNSRFQTSFTLENTQSVTGFLRILVPREQREDWLFLSYLPYDSVKIAGGESLRLNLITNYSINRFGVDPGLSFNRDTFFIDLDEHGIEHDENKQPSPFLEAPNDRIEDIRIVVDDLDDGFRVTQRIPSQEPPRRFGPIAWVTVPRATLELDANLPIRPRFGRSQQIPNIWQRWNYGMEVAPFGRYRRSTAYIQASISKNETIPNAEFATDLPKTGKWLLEYFYPWLPGTTWGTWGIPEDNTVSLAIVQGESNYQAPLNLRAMPYGWNEIGTYSLNDEEVTVRIVFRPKSRSAGTRIFADAVRWTPIQDPSS